MLEWYGDEVAAVAEAAMAEAMAEVVDHSCVPDAQAHTPVETGAARASIHRDGSGLELEWGYHVDYGVFIEIGESGRTGHHALRRAGDSHYNEIIPAAARRFGGV